MGKTCGWVRKALGEFLRTRRAALRTDTGMSTVEYALGLLTAAGVAAMFYKVMSSGSVTGALQSLVTKALDAPF
ncbi:DUF4244 domain-containing protein [Streptomyces omiyaensis]|uniref:DUF4244 domain-containing protein n=1 Tax=Streptomyces omiyaensis TaxID=68247 RepID=A0ABW7BYL8_9ACTN|nr:DUF4244 domain-containing protein [Streptomyces omiyaensis]GGY43836.1 hypothetical protein GCM10010363_25830 [Streptomyces omiyaensis]